MDAYWQRALPARARSLVACCCQCSWKSRMTVDGDHGDEGVIWSGQGDDANQRVVEVGSDAD